MVASADGLATQAGLTALARGGNAVDAAIATNAAIAVTAPHLCGMGGDLFALVHEPGSAPVALNASGRAGSGADAGAADAPRGTPRCRSATTSGRSRSPAASTGGWRSTQRYGRLPLGRRAGARHRAGRGRLPGLAAPRRLAGDCSTSEPASTAGELAAQATPPGALVRRPGAARTLRADRRGRAGRLLRGRVRRRPAGRRWPGYFTADDLARRQADWVERAGARRVGSPAVDRPSELARATWPWPAAWIAQGLPLPDDPDDPRWAHLLIEAAMAAGHDRPDVLHDGRRRRRPPRPRRASPHVETPYATESISIRWRRAPAGGRRRHHLPVHGRRRPDGRVAHPVQRRRLRQLAGRAGHAASTSTTAAWASRWRPATRPSTGRAAGRPTRSPAPRSTHPDGRLAATLGTMGGDGQPQILLQLLARLFLHGQHPAKAIGQRAVGAARGEPPASTPGPRRAVPASSSKATPRRAGTQGSRDRGHGVSPRRCPSTPRFGHAHTIVVEADGHARRARPTRGPVGAATAAAGGRLLAGRGTGAGVPGRYR